MGGGYFLRKSKSPSGVFPNSLWLKYIFPEKIACPLGGKKCYFLTPLDFNDYFLSTAIGFFRVISNAILIFRIQIDFLST